MNTLTTIIKTLCIVMLCFVLNSSSFVYFSTTSNENYDKNVSNASIENRQYEAYLDSLYIPIETFYAELTGYGPDCKGCSGILAYGIDTEDLVENIYYEDKEYGFVRVLASSSKYPSGTIMKFSVSKLSDDPIVAIVLDRGGAIQENKLDLLMQSESDSSKYVGRIKNLKVEVLRRGW